MSLKDNLSSVLRRIDWLTLGVGPTITRTLRYEPQDGSSTHRTSDKPSDLSANMAAIQARRGDIAAAFEEAARSGFIPADALIEQLHRTYLDEVAEEQRQLDRLEQELEAHLRRWNSLFPAALPPEPEPPTPPRTHVYRPIRDIWGPASKTRH